jgi:hypothetical protein
MNPKWLVPIGLVLGLGLLGVAGATKPLQYAQLWLDQRDSPYTAAASAIAPIIDCVNRVDRETRLAYYFMSTGQEEVRSYDKFGDRNEPDARYIRASVCSELYTLKLRRQQPDSPLLGPAATYAASLNSFTSLADRVTLPEWTSAAQQILVEAVRKQYALQLAEKGQDYLAASTALRTPLEQADMAVRPAQLALIEARFGRDMHWQVLNYMIAARQAVNQIEQGMRNANLTPPTVAAVADTVQQAADSARAYVRTHPGDKLDEEAHFLWYTLNEPADAYLSALRTLTQHWHEHAPPQQLSDDYYLVTRRYDALLSYYNKPARNAF